LEYLEATRRVVSIAKLGEEQRSESKVHSMDILPERTWLEHVGLTPEDMQSNVPTRNEYNLGRWLELTKHVRVVTDAACAKIERKIDMEYDEYYGDEENQKLLMKQRGWESLPKEPSYSMHPEAIKSRAYRDNLIHEDVLSMRETNTSNRAAARALKDPRTASEKRAAKDAIALEKKLAREQRKVESRRLKRAHCKKTTASTAAPED
jgi:hypothetical protein